MARIVTTVTPTDKGFEGYFQAGCVYVTVLFEAKDDGSEVTSDWAYRTEIGGEWVFLDRPAGFFSIDFPTTVEFKHNVNGVLQTTKQKIDWMDKSFPAPIMFLNMENGTSDYSLEPHLIPDDDNFTSFTIYYNGENISSDLWKRKKDSVYGEILVLPKIKKEGNNIIKATKIKNGHKIEKIINVTLLNNEMPTIEFKNVAENKTYTSVTPNVVVNPEDCDLLCSLSRSLNNQLIEKTFYNPGTLINKDGNYELSVQAMHPRNGNSAVKKIKFNIDGSPPPPIKVFGIVENDVKPFYSIRILKEEGINYFVRIDDIDISFSENVENGNTYLELFYKNKGQHSLKITSVKISNNVSNTFVINLFTVLNYDDTGHMIEVDPLTPSYDKWLNVKFSNLAETHKYMKFNNNFIDYSWDKLTKDIHLPNDELYFWREFNTYDAFKTEEAFSVREVLNGNLLNSSKQAITSFDHNPPPVPKISGCNNGDIKNSFLINIENLDSRYKYVIKLNGQVLDKRDIPLIVDKEGFYLFQVICIKNNFTYSENKVNFRVKEKYRLLAPYIMNIPVAKDTNKEPGVRVYIYFHPYSDLDYYQIGNNPEVEVPKGTKRVDFLVSENTTIRAYSVDNDGHLVGERFSKCCHFANPLDCQKSWKVDYNTMIGFQKYWNVEFYYYPDLQQKMVGIKYRTINNINEEMPVVIPPKILGIDRNDFIQYSAFPHVKREKKHNYFAYLDGEPYELGSPIRNRNFNGKRKHKLVVFAEQKDNKKRASSEIEFVIDSIPPSFPKMINPIKNIMTQPVVIDCFREPGVFYSATLNGKPFTLGKTLSENGEYLLVITAEKGSNRTKRFKAIYFSINTFEPQVLEPLRVVLKPLEDFRSDLLEEEELLVNRTTGDVSMEVNGKMVSKTKELMERVSVLESKNIQLDKLYYDVYERIKSIFERVKENKDLVFDTIDEVLSCISLIDELVETTKKYLSKTNERSVDLINVTNKINDIVTKTNNTINKQNQLFDYMNKDRLKLFTILRQKILYSYSKMCDLYTQIRELELAMQGRMNKTEFANWKEQQMQKYYQAKKFISDNT